MKSKSVSGMVLTLLFVGTLILAFNIQPIKSDWTWTETIYIRADGSIDPNTAPISSVDNVTYTLTDNIVGDVPEDGYAIVVERDNIIVDGAGYTLQGTGNGTGMDLTGRSNITIKNTKIKTFYWGVYLSDSSNITISGNNITNNYDGIWLDSSPNNSISGNNILANDRIGIYLSTSSSHSISGNNITNNEDGVWLDEGSNYNTISENSITKNHMAGIGLRWSSNNTLRNNDASNNEYNFGVYGPLLI